MATKKRGKQKGQRPRPEGELRQSQLVTTFGPGAMVDLVDRAIVVGGLEHWGYGRDGYVKLDDPRLRRSLLPRLKALDPNLDLAADGYFRMPPAGDSRDPYIGVGIRVLEFPRWFVCQGCKRLARAGDQFENKGGRYRHECRKNKSARATPVRFVAACRRGHLADFPWLSFVHGEEGTCDRPELYLEENATGDIGNIIARCANCSARQSMNNARFLGFGCSGERPWLGGKALSEPCKEKLELLVRTASDAYFSQVVSALRLPEETQDPIRLRLRDAVLWKAVRKVKSADQLSMLVDLQDEVADLLDKYPADKVLQAIEAERGSGEAQEERPLRTAEYERIMSAPMELPGVLPDEGVEFAAYRIPEARAELPPGVRGLVVVPELREVRVQVSFSRLNSVTANLQGEYDFEAFKTKPAVLTNPTGNEKWLPAAEIRGEGVFIHLDEEAVHAWERQDAVRIRAEMLFKAAEADDRAAGFPGIRFYLLHSLSHLLLTAISLECGYAASAIRERIYCGSAEMDGPNMAGILLSTGTTGSEGTLGGLVEEGRRITHHLREAWDLGRLCSNDPVCAAHDPSSGGSDRSTEGAACHGCLYIAECSCERFNRYLDRALVVPTIGIPELAFFQQRP